MPRRQLGTPLPKASPLAGHGWLAFKNLFRSPVTVPVGKVLDPDLVPDPRGTLENDHAACIHCSKCVVACPVGCLEVDMKASYWKFDMYACIGCGRCESECPTKALSFYPHQAPPAVHQVVLTHERVTPEEAKAHAEALAEAPAEVEEARMLGVVGETALSEPGTIKLVRGGPTQVKVKKEMVDVVELVWAEAMPRGRRRRPVETGFKLIPPTAEAE